MSLSKFIDKDRGWAALFARAAVIRKGKVKVGVLADESKGGLHHKGADGKAAPLTVAEIAAVLEFGTKDGKIPPRPVLTVAFEKHRDEMIEMASRLIVAVLHGSLPKKKALGLLGEFLKSKAQALITSGVQPPNAPSTMLRKILKGKGVKAAYGRLERATERANEEITLAGNKEGPLTPAQLGRETFRRIARHAAAEKNLADKLAASAGSVKPWIDTGQVYRAFAWMLEDV